MAGMAVAGVGGLFALGIIPAILERQPGILIANPTLSLLSWLVSLPLGWFLGGLLGRLMGDRFRAERPEIIGGVVGGLLALGMIAALGWYLYHGASR